MIILRGENVADLEVKIGQNVSTIKDIAVTQNSRSKFAAFRWTKSINSAICRINHPHQPNARIDVLVDFLEWIFMWRYNFDREIRSNRELTASQVRLPSFGDESGIWLADSIGRKLKATIGRSDVAEVVGDHVGVQEIDHPSSDHSVFLTG